MVERTIVQFMRGWLHGVEKISVAFSPPWGNAWKIPVETLSGDDVREHVEWELQQRLKDSLHSNIFAWNRVNGDAYAVVIRPELLSFWEDMLRNRGLELSSVTITSGLVDPEIEQEADLLPLLHLWQEKGSPQDGGEDHSINVQDPFSELEEEDKDVLEAEESNDDKTVNFNADALSQQLSDQELDEVDLKSLSQRGDRNFLPWMLGSIAVLVVAGAIIWFFREPLLGLLQTSPDTTPLVEQMDDAEPGATSGTDTATPVEPQAVASSDAVIQRRAGTVLDRLFAQANEMNVNLAAVILQGPEVLFEASGDAAALSSWKSAAFSGLSLTPQPHENRGGAYQLDSVALPDVPETQLTVTEFDLLASDAGLRADGPELYTADMASLTTLFTKMAESGKRPWRLSVHKTGTDSYRVMMMP